MAWNVGVQHKLWHAVILDVAYVGSSSKDLLRQKQINAVPYGATFLPENQDPTRAPSTMPGATALPDDLLRPYPGYGNIRLWEYTAYSNYHALQTSLNRRFDNGLMFSVFYVWSKALGIDRTTTSPRAPERHRRGDPPRRLLLPELRPAAQLRGQLRLPDAQGRERRARRPGERLADLGRLPLDERPAVRDQLLDPRHRAREPHRVRPARTRASWSPATRARAGAATPTGRSTPSCFAPPQPGSDGTESARFFLHGPPIDNLDLSVSKSFALGKGIRLEVRLDAFNALNHTQFTGVNSTVSFASLTDWTITNLPYDAKRQPGPEQRLREHQRRAPPRTLQLVTRLTF